MAMTVKERLFKIWNLAETPNWTASRRWDIAQYARDAWRELDDIDKENKEVQKSKPPRSIQELAKEAIEVQNACNLSGVVLSWSQAILDLRANLPDAGTATINHHPINVMWASKVQSLTGVFCEQDMFSKAYLEVQQLAKGG